MGASTDTVRLVFVLTYTYAGIDMLNLGKLINLDEKIKLVDIFTNIGIVYVPTYALAGTMILKCAGAPA